MLPPSTNTERIKRMLLDIRLEAATSMRNLETEDPLRDSLLYISDVATSAIKCIDQTP